MIFKAKAQLEEFLPKENGIGRNGEWHKQSIVIKTLDDYPNLLKIDFWNDRIRDVENKAIGETLEVSFSIDSKVWNDKYYTNMNGVSVISQNGEVEAKQPTTETKQEKVEEGTEPELRDELPF